MKKINFVIITVIIFSASSLLAQVNKNKKIPEGMELRMIGQTALVVPENARVKEKDGLIIVEGIDKYVARSLSQMRKNIEKVEKQQQEIIKQIQKLKSEFKSKEEN